MSIIKSFIEDVKAKEERKAMKYLSSLPVIVDYPDGSHYCDSETGNGGYIVHPDGTCTCPWATKINPDSLLCKHGIAVLMLEEMQAVNDLYYDDISNASEGYGDPPYPDIKSYLWDKYERR